VLKKKTPPKLELPTVNGKKVTNVLNTKTVKDKKVANVASLPLKNQKNVGKVIFQRYYKNLLTNVFTLFLITVLYL